MGGALLHVVIQGLKLLSSTFSAIVWRLRVLHWITEKAREHEGKRMWGITLQGTSMEGCISAEISHPAPPHSRKMWYAREEGGNVDTNGTLAVSPMTF